MCRCAGSTAGPLEYTENQTKMEKVGERKFNLKEGEGDQGNPGN